MYEKGYMKYGEFNIGFPNIKCIEYWIKFGHIVIVEYYFNGGFTYYKNVDSVI